MPRQRTQVVMTFPPKGINVVVPRARQTPDTCVNCLNVRAFDTQEERIRGGLRPGLSKYVSSQIDGSNRIQDINYAVTVLNAAPNTSSLFIRDVRAMAISNGTVAWFSSSTVNAANTSGNTTLNSSAPFIFSAQLFGSIYITDGFGYKIWVSANNTTTDWTPTAGTLPGDPPNTSGRLIEMWRSRIVISGLRTDPHNWFMSKLGDPLDWDYAPATVTEIQAVTGGVGNVGKMPDVINCMIPYSDDLLVFGCDSSIWLMSGDPQAGGRLDLISDTIGMAFGRPWCKSPEGVLYFFSSRGEVYQMIPNGSPPQSLTEDTIDPLLKNTDLNTTFVRMAWNDEEDGFNLWLTTL